MCVFSWRRGSDARPNGIKKSTRASQDFPLLAPSSPEATAVDRSVAQLLHFYQEYAYLRDPSRKLSNGQLTEMPSYMSSIVQLAARCLLCLGADVLPNLLGLLVNSLPPHPLPSDPPTATRGERCARREATS